VSGQDAEVTVILAAARHLQSKIARQAGTMAEKKSSKKEDAESREERMARFKHLLADRSEEAAKMVKSWFQQANGKPK